MTMRQFIVFGRRKPTDKTPASMCPVFRMRIFAPNHVVAKSRFFYFLSSMKKIKRANGEIVSVHEVFEKNSNTVKNFGVWLRYDSRSGTHNMYKEFRDTSLSAAISKLYAEMASRHRSRSQSIQILRTATLTSSQCKRPNVVQFHDSKIQFRMLHRVPRVADKKFRSTFKANKPCAFF